MFKVQDTILSDDIATARFACDLPKCKGACCVVGDAGAPVAEDEVSELERAFELLQDELHPQAREKVQQDGLIQETVEGHELSCRNNRECVFVLYSDDGIAYCAIQKAFFEGRLDWEKPLSCHLYPIRLKRVGEFEYANFEYVDRLCSVACTKGKENEVFLSKFLEDPLIRRYGEDWYEEFENACKEIRTKTSEAVSL